MNDAVIEIKSQLEAVEARKSELEFSLAEAKVLARRGVAEQVIEMVHAAGFEMDEILELLTPRGRIAIKDKARKQWPQYALIGDPTKTYSRGPLPAWLKEAMLAAGMQPDLAEHRAAFRAEYMALAA